MEEGTQRAGEYSNNGGIYFTRMQSMKQWGRMWTRHEQKDLQPLFTQYRMYNVHALITILLKGQGATDFHAKTPEKKRENWARKPL